MAAEWRFENRLERRGAARVCIRVYEELDDFIEEVQTTLGNGDHDETVLRTLAELKRRLLKTLPFDPGVAR